MRRSDARLALAAALFLRCAAPLDAPPAGPPPPGGPPLAPGCLLFRQGNPGIALLRGAGRSLLLSDAGALWTFDGALTAGGVDTSGGVAGFLADPHANDCFASAQLGSPAFTSAPGGPNQLVVPLDAVEVSGTVWSYYQLLRLDPSSAFGVTSEGFGVAALDGGQFAPGPLLWAGDGPSFGQSALLYEGALYVHGCGTLGGAPTACYVARVAPASLTDASAYEYAAAGGGFTTDPAQAAPVLDGVGEVSVRPDATGRLLASYVLPLATTLVVRSALTPAGPFSQPHELAACELGQGDFCSGARQHPELEADAGLVALSYAANTFNGEPAGTRYWPRLVVLPLPADLP